MNIYNAIMNAADHIEKYPKEFIFSSTRQPSGPSCGTPGCALGWIGSFAGYASGRCSFGAVARELLKVPCHPQSDGDSEFYDMMEKIGGSSKWERGAKECARVLRLYADKYHKPAGIPDSVRAIFAELPGERVS